MLSWQRQKGPEGQKGPDKAKRVLEHQVRGVVYCCFDIWYTLLGIVSLQEERRPKLLNLEHVYVRNAHGFRLSHSPVCNYTHGVLFAMHNISTYMKRLLGYFARLIQTLIYSSLNQPCTCWPVFQTVTQSSLNQTFFITFILIISIPTMHTATCQPNTHTAIFHPNIHNPIQTFITPSKHS